MYPNQGAREAVVDDQHALSAAWPRGVVLPQLNEKPGGASLSHAEISYLSIGMNLQVDYHKIVVVDSGLSRRVEETGGNKQDDQREKLGGEYKLVRG